MDSARRQLNQLQVKLEARKDRLLRMRNARSWQKVSTTKQEAQCSRRRAEIASRQQRFDGFVASIEGYRAQRAERQLERASLRMQQLRLQMAEHLLEIQLRQAKELAINVDEILDLCRTMAGSRNSTTACMRRIQELMRGGIGEIGLDVEGEAVMDSSRGSAGGGKDLPDAVEDCLMLVDPFDDLEASSDASQRAVENLRKLLSTTQAQLERQHNRLEQVRARSVRFQTIRERLRTELQQKRKLRQDIAFFESLLKERR